MKRSRLLFLGLVIASAQLAAPIYQIWREEDTLRHGLVFKLRTAPVDPYDAFRGRYVALAFQDDSSSTADPGLEAGQFVYATLITNADGFARIEALRREPPVGEPSFRVRMRYSGTFDFPFDRYYLEESKAPLAEQVYRQNSSRQSHSAYVTIRVKDGHASLEKLYVQDQPIESLLQPSP